MIYVTCYLIGQLMYGGDQMTTMFQYQLMIKRERIQTVAGHAIRILQEMFMKKKKYVALN